MPFSLPTSPAPNAMDAALQSYGADFSSPFGGGQQRVNRPGDRYMISVSLPPMKASKALAWLAAREKALGDTVTMRVYQPGVVALAFGSPVVASNTSGGTSLPISGATASAVISAGLLFSIVRGSQRYLHRVAENVTLSGSGTGTLTIRPGLRAAMVAGDTLEFATPTIQGFMQGTDAGYSVDTDGVYRISFQIVEDK